MITFQVGVDTAKVRVSRSAKEEKVVKENEATEENIVVVDEKETIPVLKPSLKADESDAVNAIQVAAYTFSVCLIKTDSAFSKVEPQKEVTEEVKKAEEIEVRLENCLVWR